MGFATDEGKTTTVHLRSDGPNEADLGVNATLVDMWGQGHSWVFLAARAAVFKGPPNSSFAFSLKCCRAARTTNLSAFESLQSPPVDRRVRSYLLMR